MTCSVQDAIRADALRTLLTLEDPPELQGRRRYRYSLPGDGLRKDQIKLKLATDWLRYRQEAGKDESAIVSLRRYRDGSARVTSQAVAIDVQPDARAAIPP